MTEITPARLRELARITDERVDDTIPNSVMHRYYADVAAALRAAADQMERLNEENDRRCIAALYNEQTLAKLTATLAARDALLRNVSDELQSMARLMFSPTSDVTRALAAEIAAALGAGIPPNTDDQEQDDGR